MNIIFTILFLFISGTVYAQECTQPSCFQQKDKELTGLANTTSAPDRVPWFVDAEGNMDLAPFTALGRSIVGATSASQINTILGVSLVTTHPRVTVATLPAVPVTNEVVVVTDALAASSCIVNGGTTNVTCQWTGAAWVAIGGGGGGGAVAGTDTQVQFNDSNIMAGDPGLTYDKASNVLTVTGDVIVAGQSVCQEDGTNCPSGGAPAFNTVTAGTNTDKLVIGTGGSLGVSGTGTITPQYTPSGSIAATTVQGAIAELDAEKQPLDADLTALAGNSTAGFWAAATNAARTLTGTAGNITITNGNGTVGNPVWDVGANVALTTRSFTAGLFDYSFLGAASLTPPNATGAAPTTLGRIALDISPTPNRLKYGAGGVTYTIANTADLAAYQPLHANLTAFAGLTGAANIIPRFTGVGAISPMTINMSCPNSGGNTLNTDGTNIICGSQGGSGFSNGVADTFPVYATTSTMVPSLLSQAAGTVTVAGNLAVNCTTACINFDMSAYSGHTAGGYALPVAYGAVTTGLATIPVTVGARTNGEVVKFNADGAMVAGGAAGAGTWTDSSTKVGTNLTVDVEATGNVITTVQKIWLPAAGGTVAAPGLLWDATTTAPTPVCTTGATNGGLIRCTADFPDSDGDYTLQQTIALPSDWTGAIDAKIKWRTATANAGLNVFWQVMTVCMADGEVDDAAWNTASTVADAGKGTANQLNDATITGVTATGCAAGELMHLQIFRNRTNGSDTMTGVVSLVGVELTTRRSQ